SRYTDYLDHDIHSFPTRRSSDLVVKRFGDHTVLEDLNFTVSQGERVTLIGPSGSGKTTILRLVMTLEELTGGYIHIGGTPLADRERKSTRLNSSHVSNSYAVFCL